MLQTIVQTFEQSQKVQAAFLETHLDTISHCAASMADTLEKGGKLLLFGNGGSAADAQHIAAEFVNRFQMERLPLAAMALTTDTSILTSIGNDYGFEEIFQKQILALGRPRDMAIGITTSGNSPNVIRAMETAKARGLTTVAFSGAGGRIAALADICFSVPSTVTARVQETHILLAHVLCDLTEKRLFAPPQGE